ncbi:MAG: MFS transporter [Chloroflexi bacterium]|nr:MFS transporter [Chloroflexota bacterium]
MKSFSGARGTLGSVLQNADFRVIWYVGSLGEVGRRMELLVLSWLVLQLTDSYFQLGLVLAFNNLSRPMVSMFTGYIADRFPRGRILIASQALNVLTTAALLAVIAYDFDLIKPWHVFGAVFVQGLTKAIEDPSRRTAIFDIVGQGRLVNALSLDVISHNIGKMTGPIVGGILLDTAGFTGAYVFLLVVHVSNLGLMTRLRIPSYQGPAHIEPVLRSLRVAVRYAWGSPVLVGLFYITIVMNALAFPVQQFIPAIGRDHLGVGVILVGLLVAADGFGQLAGAGIMAITRDLRYHGRIFVLGCGGVLLIGVIFVWSPWYALTFGLLTVSGVAQSGFSTMQSAITMLATPHDMRGRMMGLLSVCIGVGTPLGALEIGAVASAVSIQLAISLNAVAGILLLVPAVAFSPLLWKPLTQAEPEIAPEPGLGPETAPQPIGGDAQLP